MIRLLLQPQIPTTSPTLSLPSLAPLVSVLCLRSLGAVNFMQLSVTYVRVSVWYSLIKNIHFIISYLMQVLTLIWFNQRGRLAPRRACAFSYQEHLAFSVNSCGPCNGPGPRIDTSWLKKMLQTRVIMHIFNIPSLFKKLHIWGTRLNHRR